VPTGIALYVYVYACNNLGTAECILMTFYTGEFYKHFLTMCYSPDPQSSTESYFTFSFFDLNTVRIYQNHHSKEVRTVKHVGVLG
jgi:hypothetical protein